MKRISIITTALLLLLSMLVSCSEVASQGTSTQAPSSGVISTTEVQTTETSSTEVSTKSPTTATPSTETPTTATPSTETPTLTPTETTDPAPLPDVMPSSYTLLGTKHLPKPDNQGSIGSCSSEAITYSQFTVAVSQYMNYYYPEYGWDPSSDNADFIFSPKFTYNFSGPGTEYAYRVLMDNGCLPMSVCITEKPNTSTGYWGPSNVNAEQSRSWDVSEGLMQRALNFRLTGFEEEEFTSTNDGKLTTNEHGREILQKTKEALVKGNAVVLSGWSSYWQYTRLDKSGVGTLANPGDNVIWNGYKRTGSTSDGNHCITIIGYDDDITLTVNGITMKGAFLLRNSWGAWMNSGNCFIMYDAFNVASEFRILNVPEVYNGSYGVSISANRLINPLAATANPLYTTFIPVGETTFGDETYPTYYLFDGENYLGYAAGKTRIAQRPNDACVFALIPYEKAVETPENDFRSSYLLYAVNSDNGSFLGLTDTYNNASLTMTDDLSRAKLVCFSINQSYDKGEDGSFSYMIATKLNCASATYERTGCFYRFSWTYWDKNIAVGMPELMIEAEVSMTNRQPLDISVTRTDKNGVRDIYKTAAMYWRTEKGVLPGLDLEDDEYLSFSGKSNITEPETGFFSFTFEPLLDLQDKSIDEFLWGVDVSGTGVTVKSLKLIDKDGNVISYIKTGEDEQLERKEKASFLFYLGGEISSYFGTGSYRLRNVGTGKCLTLSAKTSNMTFVLESGLKDEAQKSVFRIEYNEEKGGYYFWNYLDTFVIDVSGKKLVDGAATQLNKLSFTSVTQIWSVTQDEEGRLIIASKEDPSLVFGYDGKNITVHHSDGNENDLWCLEAVDPLLMTTEIKKNENGSLDLTLRAPEKYESGTITLKVVKDGTILKTVDVALKDGEGKVILSDLDAGTYLFSSALDGRSYGVRMIYTVA